MVLNSQLGIWPQGTEKFCVVTLMPEKLGRAALVPEVESVPGGK